MAKTLSRTCQEQKPPGLVTSAILGRSYRWQRHGEECIPKANSAVRPPSASSIGGTEGRAKGALICAFFGSVWMFWAAAFVPTARPAALAFVAAITIVIVGWSISR